MSRKAYIFILAIGLALVASYYLRAQIQFVDLIGYRLKLSIYVEQNPWLARSAFFAAYIVLTALSAPIASLLSLFAGFLMPVLWATLGISLAATVGSVLAFWFARYLARDEVRARFGAKMQTLDEAIAENGSYYLLALRLNPVVPFFLINLAFGLTEISTFSYFWMSWVGMLPGSWLYVNAGAQLSKLNSFSDIISWPVGLSLAALGLAPLLIRRISKFQYR